MKSNIIPLIILTLVIAASGYWYFTTQTGNQAPLTTSSSKDNAAQTQFQTLVSELQPITFTMTIFSDPKFTSLVNLSVPVTDEPSGRPDPFAPVPGVTGL